MAKTNTLEATALDYLARGWSVIPFLPRDKRPALRWQAFQERLPSEDEVRDWFHRWPAGNLGIVTGALSGLIVLDVDPKHGGEASLRALEEEHGPLPVTLEAVSGGGGRHLYFRHPGGALHNRAGLRPGIDLRGDGGCIVTPPSLHASGRRYRWAPGRGPGERDPAPLPGWLLRELTGEDRRPGHSVDYWRERVKEGVPEGLRNSTIASLAGHLLWHGVDPEVVTELLVCWNMARCRPPLALEEVVRTVASITRLHLKQTQDRA